MARSAHPNMREFSGVLTFLDCASDKAPSGARGHRVILTKEAARNALDSLVGMAVDFKTGWSGHDARQKVGVITDADIFGDALHVKGYVYIRDFPEFKNLDCNPLGMSYEIHNAHVVNLRASVWVMKTVTFTGAAILLAKKAAYTKTSFHLE